VQTVARRYQRAEGRHGVGFRPVRERREGLGQRRRRDGGEQVQERAGSGAVGEVRQYVTEPGDQTFSAADGHVVPLLFHLVAASVGCRRC
jgi:hypothetical protein